MGGMRGQPLPPSASNGALSLSIARGRELARRELALRQRQADDEAARKEEIRARAERRKSYARAISSPRRPSRRPSSPGSRCEGRVGSSLSISPRRSSSSCQAVVDSKKTCIKAPPCEEVGKKRVCPASAHGRCLKKTGPVHKLTTPPALDLAPLDLAHASDDSEKGSATLAMLTGRSAEELLDGIEGVASFEDLEAACATEQVHCPISSPHPTIPIPALFCTW